MMFAICLPLEIPVRGFPVQMNIYEKCRISKGNTNISQINISQDRSPNTVFAAGA